jgi:sigma-B regulation protein RsbU (phosphoserine phosphatase)
MSDLLKDCEAANRKIERLECLLRSFAQLTRSLDLNEVLDSTLKNAVDLMNAETASIALIDEKDNCLHFVESTDRDFDQLKKFTIPLGEGIAGDVAVTGRSVRLDDIRNDSRFYNIIDKNLGHTTISYLCVPLIIDDRVIGTAQIMNRKDGKSFSVEDENLMSGFARQAALAIQNARLHEVLLRQKAIDMELNICSQIQHQIFPVNYPLTDRIEFFGASKPCREVGGDYYTYVSRPDGSFDFVIGDVSGKGLSAALMVAEFHTGIHMLSQLDCSLGDMISRLNRHLTDTLIMGKFITLFIARYYPKSDEFRCVLSGHPAPYLIRTDGSYEEIGDGGMALGITRNAPIYETGFQMKSGDLLFCWTDGYPDARNRAGELFGDERLRSVAIRYANEDTETIHEALEEEIALYSEDVPATDDATLLLLKKR